MKLVRVGPKVHLSGKPIKFYSGKLSADMPTMKCNQRKSFFNRGGHVFEFEGELKDVTCKKCLAKVQS